MAKKRDREFFICPRWQEVVEAAGTEAAGKTIDLDLHPKTIAAIKAGRPLARSTVRKALFAVRRGVPQFLLPVANSPVFRRFYASLTSESPKQNPSIRFCSTTVQAPASKRGKTAGSGPVFRYAAAG